MPYDSDGDTDGTLTEALLAGRAVRAQPVPPGIEQIVTLIELAALELSPRAGATFTRDDLVRVARRIGAADFVMRDEDIAAAMPNCAWLKDTGSGRLGVA